MKGRDNNGQHVPHLLRGFDQSGASRVDGTVTLSAAKVNSAGLWTEPGEVPGTG
ncbi:hypothetical protein SAMN06264365_102417 [Actinoplanes regularis]|uniref:Uncharacterized protein n=1 Tax=Actinoplanes regularis TaxID=52697 RepID=A0A238WDH4_9ACTN|nr:hypothetical protein Areg01_01380 [Actinoplanes regularis]SNR44411.1 hypothetical protein SAMN06264365_102417 [Actinoplanes regularis]